MPLIVFEGADGTGKSTLSSKLSQLLEDRFDLSSDSEDQDSSVFLFREPGGTPIAEGLRAILKQPFDESMDVVTQSLLMFASRKQLLNRIEQLLDGDCYVILDRYVFSTYVYQCVAGNFDSVMFQDLVRMIGADKIIPDIVIHLTAPHTKQVIEDEMEQRFAGLQEKLRAGYRDLFTHDFDTVFHYYDTTQIIHYDIGSKTPDESAADLLGLICE